MREKALRCEWVNCRRCGRLFLAPDPRVEFCVPCWLEVENPGEMTRLRKESNNARVDCRDLFRIIEAEAAIAMQQADFREQVRNICRAAWVLRERIEEFRFLQGTETGQQKSRLKAKSGSHPHGAKSGGYARLDPN